MELQILDGRFAVCKLAEGELGLLGSGDVGSGAIDRFGEFVFFAKTDSEVSLVCGEEYAPAGALAVETGWRAMRVVGTLEFSLVGILAGISGALATAGVSIFAVSTYDTDYVLVKEKSWETALRALTSTGYTVL